ncbi:hypothetical protein B296_00007502 [Ensete ventricosum]|uniref:Uncharacterized protein n=1 Tax=Ensete ventricosum TaxID=4639 RepID=A0A426ZMR9_ENSVE|nr:hypothetical protein B296_00007502 [Ensete ventricosum]
MLNRSKLLPVVARLDSFIQPQKVKDKRVVQEMTDTRISYLSHSCASPLTTFVDDTTETAATVTVIASIVWPATTTTQSSVVHSHRSSNPRRNHLPTLYLRRRLRLSHPLFQCNHLPHCSDAGNGITTSHSNRFLSSSSLVPTLSNTISIFSKHHTFQARNWSLGAPLLISRTTLLPCSFLVIVVALPAEP